VARELSILTVDHECITAGTGWEARIWDKMIENSPGVCALQPGDSPAESEHAYDDALDRPT
jgi:hypothetical protein